MPGRRMIRAPRGSAGFTLIEVMVALAMLSIVAVAVAGFFISTLKGSQGLKVRQNAQVVADSDMELIHAIKGANLVNGRSQTAVATQWSAAPSQVTALTATLSQAYDPNAGTDSLLVPLTGEPAGPESTTGGGAVQPVVDGTAYTVTNYIGSCKQPTQVAGTNSPVATPSPAGTGCESSYTGNPLYEVIVAVSWTANHSGCTSSTCYYLDTALISPETSASDPEFLDGNGATVTAAPSPSYVTTVDDTTAYSAQATTINPLTGDTPGSWDTNTVKITQAPSDGTASAASNVITYKPSASYSGGDDYLDYSVEGANGTTYYSSVQILVYPYAPATTMSVTTSGPNQSGSSCGSVTTGSGKNKVTTYEYHYTYTYTGTLTGSVADGTSPTISSITSPSTGTATLSSGTVSYTYTYTDPTCTTVTGATGTSGSTSFGYKVTDSSGLVSQQGTATVPL